MAYDSNVLRRATARLEENKRRREDQREQLRQQLYAREPRLAKLDRQLQGTMAQQRNIPLHPQFGQGSRDLIQSHGHAQTGGGLIVRVRQRINQHHLTVGLAVEIFRLPQFARWPFHGHRAIAD